MQTEDNYNVKYESTFRIGGTVTKAAFPTTIDELVELLKSKEYDMVLGSCSNVLFSSSKINKNIIFTKNLNEFSFDGRYLTVACGAKGPVIAKECAKRNLSGFEFMAGFPGSFGGMIAMNASAHQQAVSDTLVEAVLFDLKKLKIVKLKKDEMKFAYRNSIVKSGNYVVLQAVFLLNERPFEEINSIMERNVEFRKQHQPSLTFGNAGSVFKNPLNDSAGRLLDLCEFKGVKCGGAMVYEKHANFIVNFDNATSSDVIKLMYQMYSKVKERYTIELQPEIIYIGDEETEEQKLWKKFKK